MRLEFYINNDLVYDTQAVVVPPVGAEVVFDTKYEFEDVELGRCVRARVREDKPPVYYYIEGPVVEVNVSVVTVYDRR